MKIDTDKTRGQAKVPAVYQSRPANTPGRRDYRSPIIPRHWTHSAVTGLWTS